MKTLGTLAATLIMLTGCSPGRPQESPPQQDLYQVTTRWIPNPSIDLMSPEGTFLRATAESWKQVFLTGKDGVEALRERTYPGFEHAFNNSDNLLFGGTALKRPIVGTDYYEVVNFQRDGTRFVADVCYYGSLTASQTDDGNYTSGGSKRYVHGGDSFIFGPNPALQPNQQHAPPARQRGPANRPAENVFGTWVLTDVGARQMGDSARRDFLSKCNKPAPGTPTNWPSPYVRVEPPPMLPPDPGWPDAGKA